MSAYSLKNFVITFGLGFATGQQLVNLMYEAPPFASKVVPIIITVAALLVYIFYGDIVR